MPNNQRAWVVNERLVSGGSFGLANVSNSGGSRLMDWFSPLELY
jgi:hypothetical protein